MQNENSVHWAKKLNIAYISILLKEIKYETCYYEDYVSNKKSNVKK